jgi:hypothetical protein
LRRSFGAEVLDRRIDVAGYDRVAHGLGVLANGFLVHRSSIVEADWVIDRPRATQPGVRQSGTHDAGLTPTHDRGHRQRARCRGMRTGADTDGFPAAAD